MAVVNVASKVQLVVMVHDGGVSEQLTGQMDAQGSMGMGFAQWTAVAALVSAVAGVWQGWIMLHW
jgi:hypothetical protein